MRRESARRSVRAEYRCARAAGHATRIAVMRRSPARPRPGLAASVYALPARRRDGARRPRPAAAAAGDVVAEVDGSSHHAAELDQRGRRAAAAPPRSRSTRPASRRSTSWWPTARREGGRGARALARGAAEGRGRRQGPAADRRAGRSIYEQNRERFGGRTPRRGRAPDRAVAGPRSARAERAAQAFHGELREPRPRCEVTLRAAARRGDRPRERAGARARPTRRSPSWSSATTSAPTASAPRTVVDQVVGSTRARCASSTATSPSDGHARAARGPGRPLRRRAGQVLGLPPRPPARRAGDMSDQDLRRARPRWASTAAASSTCLASDRHDAGDPRGGRGRPALGVTGTPDLLHQRPLLVGGAAHRGVPGGHRRRAAPGRQLRLLRVFPGLRGRPHATIARSRASARRRWREQVANRAPGLDGQGLPRAVQRQRLGPRLLQDQRGRARRGHARRPRVAADRPQGAGRRPPQPRPEPPPPHPLLRHPPHPRRAALRLLPAGHRRERLQGQPTAASTRSRSTSSATWSRS